MGCTSTGQGEFSTEYVISDFEIHEVESRYYDAEERAVDLDDPDQVVDDNGALVYTDPESGEVEFHPVSTAQYGLFTLAAHDREGDPEHLRRARANAQALLDNAEELDDTLWFPYPSDFALGGDSANTIRSPWYSGMAQGQALSLFVRLYEHDGQEKWREGAEKTFHSFLIEKRADGPWFTLVDDDHLWFEEYAGNTDPLLVVNGHNFALFGLYDYFVHTGDHQAEELFDAGATTTLDIFPDFRVPGEASNYCVQEERCLSGDGWADEKYHMIHIQQLEMLGDITQESQFDEYAELLREDFYDPTIPL